MFEQLEQRALLDAAMAAVGIRFDAGPSVFLAEGTVLSDNSITGTMRTATLAGASGPADIDWTSLTRGPSGSFAFGTRDGFTPYASQTGTQFLTDDRWQVGSFVGRDANGAARDMAFLMQPSGIVVLLYLDMHMTRLLPSGELETFRLLINPSGGADVPAGTRYQFDYVLPSGVVTSVKNVTDYSPNGRWVFDTGEVLFANQPDWSNFEVPAIMADLDGTDGIVGIAVGGQFQGIVNGDAGRYRAAVMVDGPLGASVFGLSPSDIQNGPALANVVIELHFWNDRDSESVPNTYSIFRQSEWDSGGRTPITQGVWNYTGEALEVPPFAGIVGINLFAPDGVSVRMGIANRTLIMNRVRQDATTEQLQGIASAILPRVGHLLEMMVEPDADGHPIAYLTYGTDGENASTYSVDLVEEVGGEAVRGTLHTWVEVSARGGRRYVAGLSTSGDLLLWSLLSDNVSWSFTNLTEFVPGASPIASDLYSTGTITAAGYEVNGILPALGPWLTLGGYNADGGFVTYAISHDGSLRNWSRWESQTLGDADVDGAAFIPQVVGGWTGWNTSWGGVNFAGIDADGDMWVLWWAPGLERWRVDNLSDRAGLPQLTPARPAALVTTWNAVHIGAVDTQGHLVVAWWAPAIDAWHAQDLTADFSGPTLVADSLAAGFTYTLNTINFVALDDDGAARDYWWTLDGTWQVDTVSRSVPMADIPLGPWTVSWSTFGQSLQLIYRQNTQSIYGHNADGDLVRLVWRSLDADDWLLENLTDAAVPFVI